MAADEKNISMEKELKRTGVESRQAPFLKIHPDDNVLVALKDMLSGTPVDYNGYNFDLLENVPAKHKIFVKDMKAGDDVIMYGVLVGKAQREIFCGQVMTTSNTRHAAGKYAYRDVHVDWQPPDVSRFSDKTFNGYKRNDGRIGTANYWLFIPTVFL